MLGNTQNLNKYYTTWYIKSLQSSIRTVHILALVLYYTQKTIIARKLTRTQFNSARSLSLVFGSIACWNKTTPYIIYSWCPYEWWNPESIIHNIWPPLCINVCHIYVKVDCTYTARQYVWGWYELIPPTTNLC